MSWLPSPIATGAWIVGKERARLGMQRRVDALIDHVAGDDDEIGLERVGLGDHLLEVLLDGIDVLADVNVRQMHDVHFGQLRRIIGAQPHGARRPRRRVARRMDVEIVAARRRVRRRRRGRHRRRALLLTGGRRQREQVTIGDRLTGEAALGVCIRHRRRHQRRAHRRRPAALEPLHGERPPRLRNRRQPEPRPQQAHVMRRVGIAVARVERAVVRVHPRQHQILTFDGEGRRAPSSGRDDDEEPAHCR